MSELALTLMLFVSFTLSAKDRPEVTGTMHQVFNSIMNLQPFLASEKTFSDPKSEEAIAKDLAALSQIKHAFPKKRQQEEPGVSALSSLFIDYVKDAEKRFKSHNYEYARHRLRAVTGFCFACHTRIISETNFEDFARRIENTTLTPFQKAETYAATRQFDKALNRYQELLKTIPKDELEMMDYTRAIRHALSISVRVKRNAPETLLILETVSKRKDLPEFVQTMVTAWKKDAQLWLQEKEGPSHETGEQLLKKAKLLITHAKLLQVFPADELGDISYLRASGLLHQALDENPTGGFRGEALYNLGLCYSALQDGMLWDLDKWYFETCIREFPKTTIAKKCYGRYAAKIYLGFSGSGGTFIPEDEADKLKELRKLSE